MLHVLGFGSLRANVKGGPRRGDVLHVIWHLPHAPLASLRVRVVVHILASRHMHLWCRPVSSEDRRVLRSLVSRYSDLSAIVQEVWRSSANR